MICFLFSKLPSGRIPGPKLELAVHNEHATSPIHGTKQTIDKVAARFVDTIVKGAKQYRSLKDDVRLRSRFFRSLTQGEVDLVEAVVGKLQSKTGKKKKRCRRSQHASQTCVMPSTG